MLLLLLWPRAPVRARRKNTRLELSKAAAPAAGEAFADREG